MVKNTLLISLLILAILFSCNTGKGEKDTSEKENVQSISPIELQKYRPVFHFTPPENWINDPNGLVFFDGEYHLFYQHNPFGKQWGHMSWGHAVSKDLVHWENLPVALYEEDNVMIFSGSAIADVNNTCGLCKTDNGCLVAIYTSHIEDKVQHQSIAYSHDQGRTWIKYENNPVLDLGMKDFRDPKVFWYEPKEKWIMVVSVPLEYKVRFYQSDNLIDWTLSGEFGGYGDTSKIWECPDLIKIKVEDANLYKWVLIISSGSKYGDFTGMQYFIGDFDGEKFIVENPSNNPIWLDYGKDFYAAITYNNLPPVMNPILIGWINNWRYANSIPTYPWRGMMSIPRELTLRMIDDEYRLIQKPVVSFYKYIERLEKHEIKDQIIRNNDTKLKDISAGSFLVSIEFENLDAEEFGIDVLMNEQYKTRIGYNQKEQFLYINRTESGVVNFHEAFASVESAPLSLDDNRLKLDIVVDQSIIEVFASDGYRVITDQVYPEDQQEGLQLYTINGQARIVNLELYKVR